MKTILTLTLLGALLTHQSFGQGGAQADMVKRRAKETVNQNNVRQGVPPPAQLTPRPAPPAQPGATPPAVTQAASLAKLTADIAGFKANAAATAEQKQQFTIDMAQSARGRKPSLGTVKQFVDSLTAALATATLTPEQQARLAQDIEGVFNAKSFSSLQFDKTIEDTQAILEVGTVKRTTAISVAADLKAVGAEIRR
jgi:hypothetical protein